MSSGGRLTGLVSDAGVGQQRPVDHVGQAPLQGPDGRSGGVAVGAAAGPPDIPTGVAVTSSCGRLEPTSACEGKSKKEAIRCLKRYVAREVFAALQP